MSHSIIIVGGGVFGVTAAIELQKRGHTVSLFDSGPIPHPNAATNDICKVIRMDYGADELYMNLMEEGFVGWDAWNRIWPQPLYHETGFTIMAKQAMQPGNFEYDSFSLLLKHGHKPQRLDAAALKKRFPAWNAERYVDGYYNPRAGWAASGAVLTSLAQVAKTQGVNIREGAAYARLHEQGSRIAGIVTTDGETHVADYVVMATGAWTPFLLSGLDDVMWATGQPVMWFRPTNPELFQPPHFSVWASDIAQSGWYGFSLMPDGIFKIANHGPGKRIHPDSPRITDADDEQFFRNFLRETFPAVAAAPLVHTRLCFYCDTWDGNFWIDHDPQRPGLVVACGDSGHAFKFAPVLGGIIADVVEHKPNPYAPRFAWRTRGQLQTEDARYSGT